MLQFDGIFMILMSATQNVTYRLCPAATCCLRSQSSPRLLYVVPDPIYTPPVRMSHCHVEHSTLATLLTNQPSPVNVFYYINLHVMSASPFCGNNFFYQTYVLVLHHIKLSDKNTLIIQYFLLRLMPLTVSPLYSI